MKIKDVTDGHAIIIFNSVFVIDTISFGSVITDAQMVDDRYCLSGSFLDKSINDMVIFEGDDEVDAFIPLTRGKWGNK